MNRRPGSARTIVVIGRKGSGKSTLVKRGLAKVPRFVVWDLLGEYAELAGARLWTDLVDFREHLIAGGSVEREVFACPRSQFDAWCRWVYATGNLFVVIEELSRYAGPGQATEALGDLLDRSRHAGVDVIATAARVAQIPKSLIAQADDLVLSQTRLPNDIDYLGAWCGPRAVDRIRALHEHRFLRVRLS